MPASSVSPRTRPFERADARRVRERAALVEAVGHRQRLAVVGDGDVADGPRACAAAAIVLERRRGRRSRSCACAGRRADRRASMQPGQRAAPRPPRSRRGSRAAPGRSRRGRAPRRCPPRSRRRRALVVVDAKQPVFVQLEAALDRAVAQRDVVRLRAGEVLHRGAAALGGTSRRSAWKPPCSSTLDLVSPWPRTRSTSG